MERLKFEDYEEFACDISDTFDNIEDEFGDVSIIAKYEEAKEIIRELLSLGCDVASIDIHNEFWKNYYDEYIIGLNHDGVWCEKFKQENGYLTDESNVTYIMDNCSSAVISYCKSENIYEVSVKDIDDSENDDEESEVEHTYTVNGKTVDKETFDAYVSKFRNTDNNKSEDSVYNVTVTVDLDTNEAEKMIRDMEDNMKRKMGSMLDMLYRPYLYEYHLHPIRFFW